MDEVGSDVRAQFQIAICQSQHMAGSAPIVAKTVKDHPAVGAQVLQVCVRAEHMNPARSDFAHLPGQNLIKV